MVCWTMPFLFLYLLLRKKTKQEVILTSKWQFHEKNGVTEAFHLTTARRTFLQLLTVKSTWTSALRRNFKLKGCGINIYQVVNNAKYGILMLLFTTDTLCVSWKGEKRTHFARDVTPSLKLRFKRAGRSNCQKMNLNLAKTGKLFTDERPAI